MCNFFFNEPVGSWIEIFLSHSQWPNKTASIEPTGDNSPLQTLIILSYVDFSKLSSLRIQIQIAESYCSITTKILTHYTVCAPKM